MTIENPYYRELPKVSDNTRGVWTYSFSDGTLMSHEFLVSDLDRLLCSEDQQDPFELAKREAKADLMDRVREWKIHCGEVRASLGGWRAQYLRAEREWNGAPVPLDLHGLYDSLNCRDYDRLMDLYGRKTGCIPLDRAIARQLERPHRYPTAKHAEPIVGGGWE